MSGEWDVFVCNKRGRGCSHKLLGIGSHQVVVGVLAYLPDSAQCQGEYEQEEGKEEAIVENRHALVRQQYMHHPQADESQHDTAE